MSAGMPPQPRELVDMPALVLEKIVDKLTLVDRINFRICAKPIKEVVDNAKRYYEKIGINCTTRGFTLSIVQNGVEHSIQYNFDHCDNWRRTLVVVHKKELEPATGYGPRRQIVTTIRTRELEGSSPLDVFDNDMVFLFRKINRMYIGKLSLSLEDDEGPNYIVMLSSILENRHGRMLPVKELWMSGKISDSAVMWVLPYLLPGDLRRLQFNTSGSFDLDSISETPQWSSAPAVQIHTNWYTVRWIRFERDLSHFKFVELNHKVIEIETIQAAVTKAEEMGDQFELLRLKWQINGIRNYIEETYECYCDNPQYRYKHIPLTDNFLQFSVGADDKSLEIRRVHKTAAFTFEPTNTDREYLDF